MAPFITFFEAGATPGQITNALNTLSNAGGIVLQAWGDSVLIADGSVGVQAALRGMAGIAAVNVGTLLDPDLLGLDLDALGMALAWNVGQSPFYRAAVDSFLAVIENAQVGMASFLPPGGCNTGRNDPVDLLSLGVGAASVPSRLGFAPEGRASVTLMHPERRAMVGTIGIAVLHIDGPDGTAAAVTPTELATANFALSDGLMQLMNRAPASARLVFTPKFHHVKLTVPPSSVPAPVNPAKPTPAEYEAAEKVWRDPALTALGMPIGRAGFRQLVASSRFLFDIDWGFVFVITKYPAAWQAYAPDYRDVVVSYSMVESSLGIGELPFVCAHEIGHTVGALDEYNCSGFSKSGFNGFPNLNCVDTNPLAQPCLMIGHTFDLCPHTIGHFGWGDVDFDGLLDPFDPDFIPL